MEWSFKASWDLTELEQVTLPNLGRVTSSARYGVTRTADDFSVDLMLGQVGNSSIGSLQKWKRSGVSKTAPSPPRLSKRARALNNGTQAVACLVDGCNSDLSNCRDYHRRHKVCELHSKTPQVTVGGQKQRFCQQCSRFQLLEEFDEGKRSCRKRLDGHNRRRRKPQPEPTTRAATFLSPYQEKQWLPMATPHVYPSTSLGSSFWTGVSTSEADARLQNQHQQLYVVDKQSMFTRSSDSSYKENKQYSFPLEENLSLSNPCSNPPKRCPQSTSIVQNISCNGIARRAHESHRALSLLSSPQMQKTSGHGLNPMQLLPETVSPVQPLGPSLHYHNFESVDSVMVSTTGAGGLNLHGGMYNMGTGESQGNETPQAFPFTWD